MSNVGNFAVTAKWEGRTVLLTVRGEFDLSAGAAWEASISEALGQMPTAVTVDLGSMTFIDSSGLRLMLLLSREADLRGVPCDIVNISPSVTRLLEITGLADLVRRASD